MEDILRGYEVNAPTWFYLSLLLILAVFFRFSRVWSLRNADLLLLLSLSPGLLLIREGGDRFATAGYVWLFAATGVILLRLVLDSSFVRRPRTEQNLNVAGLTFLCVSAFAFLMTKALTEPLPDSAVETVKRAEQFLDRKDAGDESGAGDQEEGEVTAGPAASVLTAPVVASSKVVAGGNADRRVGRRLAADMAARSTAILAHLAVMAGLIVLGWCHFGDLSLGVAMATLYLLLPPTAYHVGRVVHVLPAALIVWAIVCYRRPMLAGGLMGLACGTLFFPVFLLPLWIGFYGRRNLWRFLSALAIVAAVLFVVVVRTSADVASLIRQVVGAIDWQWLAFPATGPDGFWTAANSAYRIPVFVGFVVLAITLTIWPRRKTLEHLLAHSTAIVVATQFWYPYQGGVYVLWYLPLLLAVVFRPRLVQLPQTGTVTAQAVSQPQPYSAAWSRAQVVGNQSGRSSLFR